MSQQKRSINRSSFGELDYPGSASSSPKSSAPIRPSSSSSSTSSSGPPGADDGNDNIDLSTKLLLSLQRISIIENLATKLMLENNELKKKQPSIESSALFDMMKTNVKTTLNELIETNVEATQLLVQHHSNNLQQDGDNNNKVAANKIVEQNKKQQDERNGGPDGDMISLMTGDLICLQHDEISSSGFMLGDLSLLTLGIKPENGNKTNPRFNDGIFRLCSALNFRARTEKRRGHKARNSSQSFLARQKSDARMTDITSAVFREKLENQQNAEYLEGLSQG
eukprot:CAMPEP_0114391204 /NCGR_PEP_ID=MMETSP0102-20121206/9916_1 /TAXON_ID=38822 ORGANISM="Pteridomonas danica, Strain PT" /NCGR_SAMPLE_ID=MMETSP0102 /ASSEMBLY_ACC=CAM_ASM_000212 /LENGTH=280 /DNA_ID=CAMNT_0001549853 /DNA_START=35 /DNA_END=874 /DNA_ORIENTATION=+